MASGVPASVDALDRAADAAPAATPRPGRQPGGQSPAGPGRAAAPVPRDRTVKGALSGASIDPVRGRGIPPRPPGDPADTLTPVMSPECLVIPDRVDFHVPRAVEHQVSALGLRQRDPVQVR